MLSRHRKKDKDGRREGHSKKGNSVGKSRGSSGLVNPCRKEKKGATGLYEDDPKGAGQRESAREHGRQNSSLPNVRENGSLSG